MDREFSHTPVMPHEVISGLNIKEGGIYVDGTLGGGGHSSLIERAGGIVIGIDRDKTAIEAASKRLTGKFKLVHDDYANIKAILKSLNIEKIDGALLDLGVSSHQLDTPDRGFSYRYDAPLDMRMDQSSGVTAKEIVNEYEVSEIEKILFEYGEEPFARAIARKIAERRSEGSINTTLELADIIKSALPPKARRADKHPAKRTFQAIRIAVNDELSKLDAALRDFFGSLVSGGRLAVITFHSLEDRIVKNTFLSLAGGCVCPKDFPVCVCNKKPEVRLVTKRPVIPSAREQSENPRSTSAKLRILEKL
ncbi:MAG: Ribosomal RNA small subunit methyltransferase H [Firmicutes bacterium ADurb.Bin193]|nr:MAG: Ribosomal RNA small subunit methyltransferase H [Firmicutes bacterium ADurb.Bin193]